MCYGVGFCFGGVDFLDFFYVKVEFLWFMFCGQVVFCDQFFGQVVVYVFVDQDVFVVQFYVWFIVGVGGVVVVQFYFVCDDVDYVVVVKDQL